VSVYDDATLLGTTTTAGDGTWSFTPGSDLSTGSHSFTVTATDAAGNVSAASGARSLTVDTAAPTAAVNLTAINGDRGTAGDFLTNDLDGLTVSGSNEALGAGETVEISLDGGASWSAVSQDSATTWSYADATARSDGDSVTYRVRVVDAAGNAGNGDSQAVVFDGAAPSAPAITGASDDVSPVTGTVADGGSTNDPRPTLTGTAEAGSTVSVYDGATLLGTTTTAGDGTWSFTPGSDLSTGSHSFTVTATEAAGNVSAASGARGLTVDATAPSAPAITGASDDVAPVTGSIADGGSTNDPRPALTGTAEAGSTVTLFDGATLLGTTAAAGDGSWSFTPGSDLADGSHSFTATATDAAGNVSASSGARTLTVDATAPTAPTITGASDDVAPVTGTVADGGSTNDPRPTLTGTAEPGSTVTLFDGATLLGTTTAAGDGSWSFTPSSDLSTGSHSFTATATDAAGNVSAASGARSLTVDATAPSAPAITGADDDVSPVTGTVADGSSTNDPRPTLTGTAGAGSTVTVYDGATLLGTTTTAGDGSWSFTPASDLAEGSHSFAATATDAAGNTATSAVLTITVDSTAPAAPAIDLPASDDTGSSNTDNITGLRVIDLQGTAEAGSTVRVVGPDGSTVVGTALADGNGIWVLQHVSLSALDGDDGDGVPGEDGAYSFSATASDAAGNTGSAATLTVTLDTRNPAIALSPASDTGISDHDNITSATTVTLIGNAAAGSVLRIYGPGEVLVGTVTVGPGGTWTLPGVDLHQFDGDDLDGIPGEDGPYTFEARLVQPDDSALPVGSVTVLLDTTPPSTPLVLDLQAASDTDTGTGAPDPHADDSTSDATPSFDVILPTGTGADVQPGYLLTIGYLDGNQQPVEIARTILTAADVAAGVVPLTSVELADAAYELQAKLFDQAGNSRDSADLAVEIVTDLDGVLPSIESAVEGGDFNGDGVQDALQSNVATLPLTNSDDFAAGSDAPPASFGAILAGTPVLDGAGGNSGNTTLDPLAQLANIRIQSIPLYLNQLAQAGVHLGGQMEGITIDPVVSGLLDFTLKGKDDAALTDIDPVRAGLQTRVVIDLPAGVIADTYFKIGPTPANPTPHIYAFMADGNPATPDDGAEFYDLDDDGVNDQLVITYTDGARGDDDLSANGQIRDPGFLGISSPVLRSVAVDSAAQQLAITFDKPINAEQLPPVSALTVQRDGVNLAAESITAIAVSSGNPNQLVVTLAAGVLLTTDDLITVDYLDPTSGDDTQALQSLGGADVPSFTSDLVDHAPMLQQATMASDGSSLTLAYDVVLDDRNLPAPGDFTIRINGVALSSAQIAGIAVGTGDGRQLVLSLSGATLSATDTVLLSYLDPSAADDVNAVQNPIGYDAASLGDVTADLGTPGDCGSAPTAATASAGKGQRLKGGTGADTLTGSGADDRLLGRGGNDALQGLDGNDRLKGQAGNDTLRGDGGDDRLAGGAGTDTLAGGGGNDIVTGQAGNDLLYGDQGDDKISGGAGADQLFGGAGEDFLKGGAGADSLSGGSGKDSLAGGAGADTLLGGDGADTLKGNGGNDILYGGGCNDLLLGGGGRDTLYGGDGDDSARGQGGNDLLIGNEGNDVIKGNGGRDRLYGDDGDDRLFGGAGNDLLLGGNGIDWLAGQAGNDSIQGGEGDDGLLGGAGRDTLEGGNGADKLDGGAGADSLVGGDGDDTLYGGGGRDVLIGGNGDDVLMGAGGHDLYIYHGSLLSDLLAAGHDSIVDSGRNLLVFDQALLSQIKVNGTALADASQKLAVGSALGSNDSIALAGTVLQVDVNGDGSFGDGTDFAISLIGVNGIVYDPALHALVLS